MAFIAESRRNHLYFGTEERMEFFPTPNWGAPVSPEGWTDGGGLINGGGYQQNSFGSHKTYMFEWPESSSRGVAQKMKSYADGSYGRGLIYFLDPLTWTTNMLPAQWADPSMGLGYEGASLVYGVDPVSVPTSGWEQNDLPVNSAYYDLAGISAGWRGKEQAVFIPIPDGYTLSLGSFHSQSGNGRVFYREQAKNGALGAITALTPLANNSNVVVNTFIAGSSSVAGVWLYVGKTASGAGAVTLAAMIGRLIPSVKTQSTMVAQNLFTNPRLVGDGTWAEVRRNLVTNPSFEVDTSGWGALGTGTNLSRSTTESYIGAASLQVITTAQSSGVWIGSPRPAVSPSGTYAASVWVKGEAGKTVRIEVNEFDSGGGNTGNTSASDVTCTGEWQRLSITRAMSSSAATASIIVRNRAASAHTFYVDAAQLEVGSVVTPYFDGSSPQGSIDPDMRQRWLGTPNASESVLEIERVAGLTAVRCIAGVSTRNGKPAVRLIATDTTSNPTWSYARFTIPTAARGGGTFIATRYVPAAIYPTSDDLRRLEVRSPITFEQLSPGPVEDEQVRLTYGALADTYWAELGHGGSAGSVDVWWTDIGLFAGSYDGPTFNGSSGVVIIGGRSVQTQWDGSTDNSTSSAWTMTPEFDRLKEGPWIGGQGHSGCRFMGKPTYINNTGVDGGQVGFAASFREVGLWING